MSAARLRGLPSRKTLDSVDRRNDSSALHNTYNGSPRLRFRSTIVFAVAGLAALSGGCAGPPVPSALEGEPVCPDYEVGATRTKLQGGLRLPVTVTIVTGARG
jgi:hypothetical protein